MYQLDPIFAVARGVVMTDPREVTTPGREPDDSMRSVWKGKGQHRSLPHSDRSGKDGQAWSNNEVKAVYPASDRHTMQPIDIYVLGEPSPCKECGYVPVYGQGGRLACNCTVWNEGIPRPISAPNPKPEAIRMRQYRKYAKGGRC